MVVNEKSYDHENHHFGLPRHLQTRGRRIAHGTQSGIQLDERRTGDLQHLQEHALPEGGKCQDGQPVQPQSRQRAGRGHGPCNHAVRVAQFIAGENLRQLETVRRFHAEGRHRNVPRHARSRHGLFHHHSGRIHQRQQVGLRKERHDSSSHEQDHSQRPAHHSSVSHAGHDRFPLRRADGQSPTQRQRRTRRVEVPDKIHSHQGAQRQGVLRPPPVAVHQAGNFRQPRNDSKRQGDILLQGHESSGGTHVLSQFQIPVRQQVDSAQSHLHEHRRVGSHHRESRRQNHKQQTRGFELFENVFLSERQIFPGNRSGDQPRYSRSRFQNVPNHSEREGRFLGGKNQSQKEIPGWEIRYHQSS